MIDKNRVLEFLRKHAQRPVRLKEMARALDVPANQYGRLKQLLRRMEDAGDVYRVRKRRYALPSRINLVVGDLQVTRGGQGFVVPDSGGDDVFVPAARLANAYAGDRVVARVERRPRGRNPEGTIVKVLERARSQVVGTYRRAGRFGILASGREGLRRDVFIPGGAESSARDGDIAVATIVDWGSDHHDPVGEITSVLGRPGEAGVDVLTIVHTHELPTDFPGEVQAEAEARARDSGVVASAKRRRDFRDLLSFTIDPADAKDHDDAVSLEKLGEDRWRVGIHIADVSHFVEERSALDLEALHRGTSVYLVDRVLPMLPEVLSGDLCSLKPGQDRLTLTLLLEMSDAGAVLGSTLTRGVIRSRHALSYEEAQDILDGRRKARRGLSDALRVLSRLAERLRAERERRGGLDFDLPESRVMVNAAGEPVDIQRILRLPTHRLIEEFMILANETVARLASRRKLPFIFRIHEGPDPDRIQRLREFVGGLGYRLAANAYRSSRALQKLLRAAEGRPEETVISTLVLRSMKQARYSAERKEHFGLGSRAYTHFTSPIRRYPDLVVHRVLKRAVIDRGSIPESEVEHYASVAAQASSRERQAMEAERDSVELKKMEYMERHVEEEFEGTISGVTAFGLFVLLDEILVEGLVHVSGISDDYYHFVEDEYSLVGEVRKRRFRLGDRVTVRVRSVDKENRELDLELVAGRTETSKAPN